MKPGPVRRIRRRPASAFRSQAREAREAFSRGLEFFDLLHAQIDAQIAAASLAAVNLTHKDRYL